METNARGNTLYSLKCRRTWKLESNKLAYDSNSNVMIQDLNKVVAPRQIYESSFWTSKEVYETSYNRKINEKIAQQMPR